MIGFIYLWTNKINGKKYLGSHYGSIDDGYTGSGAIFKKAIKKYGIENFEREIIEYVKDSNILLEREQYYLNYYNVSTNDEFYNIKQIANGGFEHINNNEELKKQNVERLKVRWKIYPHPKGMLGKKHSQESMEKTKQGWDKWAKQHLLKPVIKCTLNGEYIQEYESINEAARSVNGSASNIKYTIEGKFKYAYGCKWKYK